MCTRLRRQQGVAKVLAWLYGEVFNTARSISTRFHDFGHALGIAFAMYVMRGLAKAARSPNGISQSPHM